MFVHRSLACLGATLIALLTACESTVFVRPCADGECGGEGPGGEGPGGNGLCEAGRTRCGDGCVDLLYDSDHCGGCFDACDAGDVCSAGVCLSACQEGLLECGGRCVDPLNDPSHCGGCNNPCGFNQVCASGTCFDGCPFVDCDGLCIDISSDPLHCGRCFFPCEDGESCLKGDCVGGTCADPVCGICEAQVLAPATSLTLFGTTFGAQDGFTPGCAGTQSAEVSYLFTAPESGTYGFDTVGSSFDTVLSLLGPNGCFETACDDDTIGVASRVEAFLAAGDQVQVVIDGFRLGDFQLNINLEAPCVGPCGSCGSVVALPGNVPQTTTGTTSGANDDLVPSCTGQPGSEVVHSFTAPTTGSFVFSSASSGFDTVLTLLDSTSCMELGCNDDFGGQQTSRVTATLNQGQTVFVVVDGKNASGNYSLFINGTPAAVCPTGDLGDVVPVSVSGNTAGGVNSFTPACSFGQAPDHAYTFTAPVTKVYEMSTIGSSYDTVLHVLGATCSGISLACDDDTFGLQSRVFVDMTAGQTVTVVVDGFGSSSGSYVLNIE